MGSPAWLKKHQFRPIFWFGIGRGAQKKKAQALDIFFSFEGPKLSHSFVFPSQKKNLETKFQVQKCEFDFISLAYSAYFRPECKIQTFAVTRIFCKKNVLKKTAENKMVCKNKNKKLQTNFRNRKDPQAKFETRKGRKKNDPEKWIHKRNLIPERKEKKKKTTRK